jgi:hypothetical protein
METLLQTQMRAEEVKTDSKVKVVSVTYVFEVQSAWIVPADINPDDLWVKYDYLHYKDKKLECQKVLDAVEEAQHYDFKRPYNNKVTICNFNENDMLENDIYYDCEDGYNEEILEKVKTEIASIE